MRKGTPEERLHALETDYFALQALVMVMGQRVFPTTRERTAARDECCEHVEAIYGVEGLKPGAHETLQRVLHEMERLFDGIGASRGPHG